MRYIQTLYFPPSTNLFKEGLGWNRPEFHLMAWTLSCLQLHSYYEDVELYTNNEGGHWLIDLLHLPYTKVHTDLNSFSLLHPKIWASSKIYTYSLQKEPFIHVDGDIFLFSKLPEELTNAPLVCQNFEIATDYYTKTQKELIKYFSYFPSAVDKDFHSGKMINAVNAGLLGGHDIDFFQEYTKEAFLYIKNNSDHFENVDMDKFNVFFEQHLFYVLAKERNIPISSLFKDMHTDNGYAYIGNIYETPYRLNYIHLMAHFKRDETTCLWMAEKLRTLYPDYFYRIVNLFKDNGQSLLSSFLEREDTHDFGCLETRTIQHFQTQRFNKNKQSGLLHQKME